MPSKPVVFPVSPIPFPIFVTFVARDDDHRAGLTYLTHRLQKIDGTRDVRGIGFNRVLVAPAYHGLCRHMNDDARAAFCEGTLQALKVTYVSTDRSDSRCDFCLIEKAGLGRRF